MLQLLSCIIFLKTAQETTTTIRQTDSHVVFVFLLLPLPSHTQCACGLAQATLTTLTSSRHKWGGSRDSGGSSSSSRLRFDTVSRGPALIWYSSPRFSFSLFVFIKCVSYYCCCCCCWRSWSNCNYCGYGVLHVVVVVVCVARVVLFSLSHALLLNICPLRCTAAVLPCCSALLCDSSLWSEKCKANKQQQQQRASEAGCVFVCVCAATATATATETATSAFVFVYLFIAKLFSCARSSAGTSSFAVWWAAWVGEVCCGVAWDDDEVWWGEVRPKMGGRWSVVKVMQEFFGIFLAWEV